MGCAALETQPSLALCGVSPGRFPPACQGTKQPCSDLSLRQPFPFNIPAEKRKEADTNGISSGPGTGHEVAFYPFQPLPWDLGIITGTYKTKFCVTYGFTLHFPKSHLECKAHGTMASSEGVVDIT